MNARSTVSLRMAASAMAMLAVGLLVWTMFVLPGAFPHTSPAAYAFGGFVLFGLLWVTGKLLLPGSATGLNWARKATGESK